MHVEISSGTENDTPTRVLRERLRAAVPDLTNGRPDPRYAYLFVSPRCTNGHHGPWSCPLRGNPRHGRAIPDAWYDLHYAYHSMNPETGTPVPTLIERVGSLPAPPAIPLEQRVAAAPEPNLEGWTPRQIAFAGGGDAALEICRSQRDAAVRRDTTADVYDWDAALDRYIPLLRGVPRRKLTPEQRVAVAEVREHDALDELEAARRSLAALRANLAPASG